MSYYADQNNMKLDIQQGNIDCVWRSLSATDIEDLSKDDAVTVHDGPGGEIRYIVFNFDTMPYGAKTEDAGPRRSRKAVRQAAADLIDRQAIATSVYKDTYTPLYSYIPEGLPGNGTQFQDLYGDGEGGPDAAKAKKRLEDAGVEIPVKLSLQYNPDHYGNSSGDEYAAVKTQLEEDGLFAVDLQSTEWVQYSEDRVTRRLPGVPAGLVPGLLGCGQLPHAVLRHGQLPGQPLQQRRGQRAHRTQQRGTEDPAEREALFVKIQDIVADEISTLPLLQGAQIAVVDVRGPGRHPGLLVQVPRLAPLSK